MQNLRIQTMALVFAGIVAIILTTLSVEAQTVISGPNVSGTWSPSGSPYIVAADCSVQSGDTLTITPGTVIWIGENISITCNGQIQAVGTPGQRIKFQAPIASQKWNTIIVQGATDTNQFRYCDFSNAGNMIDFRGASRNEIISCNFSNAATALIFRDYSEGLVSFCNFESVTNGIWMTVYGNNWTLNTRILNCVFTNCYSLGIYGEAIGYAASWCCPGGTSSSGIINSTVRNCSFYDCATGCQFILSGNNAGYGFVGYGYADVTINGNLFRQITNTAVSLTVGSYAGGGTLNAFNNTLVGAGTGFALQDPWDGKIQSSLLVGCSNAVTRSGSLSATISYNGFFSNAANFTGYPSTYGLPILVNRNGTPSDVLYNIFSNPLFVSANDFHLQMNSPAIDAGTPDWAYTDMCITNGVSQGAGYPDLGAYGGPDACNWLDDVPVFPVWAFVTQTNGLLALNWGAIPRSTYQVDYLANLVSAGTNSWTNFPDGLIVATGKPTSIVVGTNADFDQRYFRVQSLGRAPGN